MKIAHTVQPFTDGEHTHIPRRITDDRRLSWTAKGLMAYLLTWPDGSEVPLPPSSPAEDTPAALAELEEQGFLRLTGGTIVTFSDGYAEEGR